MTTEFKEGDEVFWKYMYGVYHIQKIEDEQIVLERIYSGVRYSCRNPDHLYRYTWYNRFLRFMGQI